jgi:hypothetical protein
MKTRTSRRCLGISAALLLCVSPAAAQDSVGAAAAPVGKAPPRDIQLGIHTGLFWADDGGLLVGMHARYRLGFFEAGGFGEVGTAVFGPYYVGLGATAGLAWRTSFGLRLAASGALGLHVYENVGARLLSSDPGADGTTPFAGARVSASYILGRYEDHVELGVMGLYDGDLIRRTVITHYMEKDLFGGGSHEERSTHTVGTDRFGALVTIGWTRDLL